MGTSDLGGLAIPSKGRRPGNQIKRRCYGGGGGVFSLNRIGVCVRPCCELRVAFLCDMVAAPAPRCCEFVAAWRATLWRPTLTLSRSLDLAATPNIVTTLSRPVATNARPSCELVATKAQPHCASAATQLRPQCDLVATLLQLCRDCRDFLAWLATLLRPCASTSRRACRDHGATL